MVTKYSMRSELRGVSNVVQWSRLWVLYKKHLWLSCNIDGLSPVTATQICSSLTPVWINGRRVWGQNHSSALKKVSTDRRACLSPWAGQSTALKAVSFVLRVFCCRCCAYCTECAWCRNWDFTRVVQTLSSQLWRGAALVLIVAFYCWQFGLVVTALHAWL